METSLDAGAAMAAIVAALDANDLPAADAALAALPQPIPTSALSTVADVHIRFNRWSEAADALSKIPEPDGRANMLLKLATNLAAMQKHRPAVYDILIAAELSDRFTIGDAANGRSTVFYRQDDGKDVSQSLGPDPVAVVNHILEHLQKDILRATPLGICGAGDGYLLPALARCAPAVELGGRKQPVFILEAEPQLILTLFTIHDYTGAQGPIEQDRFTWCIGKQWPDELAAALKADPFLPPPEVNVRQGVTGNKVETDLKIALDAAVAAERLMIGANNVYYLTLAQSHWTDFAADRPGRPRKVLIVGSKFDESERIAADDLANGFREAGWDANVISEPAAHHRLRPAALRKAMIDLRPDLAVQFDRPRNGGDNVPLDAFPPQLPHLCWVRELSPALTRRVNGVGMSMAAANAQSRDFFVTSIGPTLIRHFGYRPSTLIPLGPLASQQPYRQPSGQGKGHNPDLVLISDRSHTADDGFRTVMLMAREIPALAAPIERLCRELATIYDKGNSLPTMRGLRRLADRIFHEEEALIHDMGMYTGLLTLVFNQLNTVLFQNQALGWAIDVAKKLKLSIEVYGHGWDKNAQLKPLYKGLVPQDAEPLAHRAKILLHLEPGLPFSDPLTLASLLNGGFHLIRQHPHTELAMALLAFVDQHIDPSVDTVEEAREQIDPNQRAEFESLLHRAADLADYEDLIAVARQWQAAKLLIHGNPQWPDLADVTFRDRKTLEDRIRHFIANKPQRQQIAMAQRTVLSARSHTTGLAGVIQRIGESIAKEPVVATTTAAAA